MKKKNRKFNFVFTAIRDIVCIFLAFMFTDYITDIFKIKSSLYEFLIYFSFLFVVTAIGMLIQAIIKKIKKQDIQKEDF